MKLSYKRHAIERMLERKITESEVLECIQNCDIKYTDKKGNPIYTATLRSGRKLKVVVDKDNPNTIITTAD